MNTSQRWLSFHIFYHTGDSDRLLVDCVLPVTRRLLQAKQVESFFFMRYPLGGPHIRLRLLPRPGLENIVREIVACRVADFVRSFPSMSPLANEVIRERNRILLGQDHNELGDVIFPDNSCQEEIFLPETERYGGPNLLSYSLDFFALSSAQSLRLLADRDDRSEGRWLANTLRLLFRQALGFARDSHDLFDLCSYPTRFWAESIAPIQRIADRVFSQHRESFQLLVGEEVRKLSCELQALDDSEMARCLDGEIYSTDRPTRWTILSSQLHMTANRLGLRNADEIYLARILRRSLDEIKQFDRALWTGLEKTLVERVTWRNEFKRTRLKELLYPAFHKFLLICA